MTWPISVVSLHQDAEAKLRSSSDVPILRHATSTWDERLGGKLESAAQANASDDIPRFISVKILKLPNLSGLQELSTHFWGTCKIQTEFLIITFRLNQLFSQHPKITNTPRGFCKGSPAMAPALRKSLGTRKPTVTMPFWRIEKGTPGTTRFKLLF